MPLAVEFAKKTKTIGFDINEDKIRTYLDGIDPTNEVGDHEIQHTSLHFTSDERELAEAAFFIVAVPTPIYSDNIPNLEPLKKANKILGRNIKKGSVIVYESTVYTVVPLCINHGASCLYLVTSSTKVPTIHFFAVLFFVKEPGSTEFSTILFVGSVRCV